MTLFSLFLRMLAFKARGFEKKTKDPLRAQKDILFEIIRRNRDTAYGREYSFGGVNSVKKYQNTCPVNTYESLYPYIERMTRGERDILTKDKPILFGTTSGTTGLPKFIPVTNYSRKKKKDVMDIWLYYIIRDYPNILDGRILAIVSPERENCTVCGLSYGAESGHAYKNLPALIRMCYALPYNVFEIKDYEAKYYCILRLAMAQKISTIATLNPSTLILLCQKIDGFRDRIIEDIENGTLRGDMDIEDDIRKFIEKRLRPDPRRAAFLRKILDEKGELLPRYFWPKLRLIECWKGGTVGIYLREFERYFGNTPVRDFGYLSSEARCSVPTDNAKCCGVLAINANFYEFVPREDREKMYERVLLCDELELGKEYFVIITTPGGLYRYDIDDLIRVTGFHNKTPRIEFIQKGLNVTSVTGEKLYESQVVEAVKKAAGLTGVTMEFFTACIQWGRMPRYVFLVEFKETPQFEAKHRLLKFIDDEIKTLNVEYEVKRRSQRLDDPILKVVKRGAFEKYKVMKVETGAHDTQFKAPQLTRDLDFQCNFDIEEEIHLK